MALKGVVDSLDSVDEAIREHYVAHTDGKFYLATDKGDIGALLRAKDHEKNIRGTAEAKAVELQTELDAAREAVTAATTAKDEALRKKTGDVTALEASWQEKVDAAEKKATDIESSLSGEINRLLVSDTALRIATEISTVPELLTPVIAARLAAEKGAEGKFHTRVLDAAGQPSASSLDELKQELLANEKFSTIMVSGKGSGGGAGGPGSGGGATEKKAFLDYSDAELSDMRQNQPDQYEALKKASQPEPAL